MNYYVYILANKTDSVVYIGVTGDLMRRLWEHRNDLIDGFTKGISERHIFLPRRVYS